jgi:hypothetical protein
MERKKVSDLVLNKLKKYDYKIHNENNVNEDEKFFVIDDAIISTNEKERFICVSFHLSSKIEDVAILTLNLNEIKDSTRLYIGSSFVFNDDDGKYMDGEEAEKYYDEQYTKRIIKSFIEDQSQKQFLVSTNGYKC